MSKILKKANFNSLPEKDVLTIKMLPIFAFGSKNIKETTPGSPPE